MGVLISQKAWGEAEQEARRLMELPEEMGVGEYMLARVMSAQGKKAEAVAALRKSLEKNPSSSLALEALVAGLTELGQGEEARKTLQDFRAKYPKDMGARFLEGTTLARAGDTAAAEKIYNDIVKTRPDASLVWAALASLNNSNQEARIDALKRGLAANPGNAELGLLLGSEYELAGRVEDAIPITSSC